MARSALTNVLDSFRRLLGTDAPADRTDAQLVERFVARSDEAAFAALVERHGPLVLGVCRQVLHDEHAAEDVFQATFLVLARKAGAIRAGEALGGWLYRVAVNLARTARTAAARRRAHERQAPEMAPNDPPSDAVLCDAGPVLHEEVSRLPDKYRLPVLLCHLEGRTHEQAAAELGWPVGTVRSRLSRARDQLRRRLQRRGMTAAALSFLLERGATAAVPAALAALTVKVALPFAAGQAVPAGLISTNVLTLAEGALKTMTTTKFKWLLTLLLALGLTAAGAAALNRWPAPEAEQPQAGVGGKPPGALKAPAEGAKDKDPAGKAAGDKKGTELALRGFRPYKGETPGYGVRLVRLTASLDGNAGQGTLTLDPNRHEINPFGDLTGKGTRIDVEHLKVTFELNFAEESEDGRKLYEIKGHGEDYRLFLVVPPPGVTIYRLVSAEKDGTAQTVTLLERVPAPGK